MKDKAAQGSLLVTAGLAVFSLIYLFFFLLPGWNAMGQVRSQVRLKRDYVMQSASTIAALAATQQEIDKTAAFNRQSARELPCLAESANVFSQITETAKTSGATTTRFDPEPAVKHDKLSHVAITMGLTGRPGQLYDFVRRLEGLPLRIWVESLKLGRPTKDGGNGTGELSLVIFVDNSEESDYTKRVE
jgi:Tfp pilus assembly protein PilO